MKRTLVLALAICLTGGMAQAADLNVTVTAGGGSSIDVAPGGTVDYVITAELSDNLNEGLALVGFDLAFDGGDLAQADTPAAGNMLQFVSPQGINNPAGFGGTVISGDLAQVGGGQNTINNDITNAPFPIGTPILGIAWPSAAEIVATGSLTAPAVEGAYTLTLSSLFANVIMQGETGNPPQPHNFWKTEAAGVGTIGNLSINVVDDVVCTLVGTTPPPCSIDARFPHEANNAGAVFGWDSIDLDFTCTSSGVPSASTADYTLSDPGLNIISVTVVGSTATVQFDAAIAPGQWTCVTADFADPAGPMGNKACLGYLPADVDGSLTSDPSDIIAVIDCINGTAVHSCEPWNADVDRGGTTDPSDIIAVIDLLNGASQFASWFGANLPATADCP